MQTNFLLKFEIFLSTLTVVMEEAKFDIDFEGFDSNSLFSRSDLFSKFKISCQPRSLISSAKFKVLDTGGQKICL